MIHVEVKKKDNENNAGILRRFTKKIQGSGIIPRVRSLRYNERVLSKFKRQKKTLKALKYGAKLELDIKMGKIPMPAFRR